MTYIEPLLIKRISFASIEFTRVSHPRNITHPQKMMKRLSGEEDYRCDGRQI